MGCLPGTLSGRLRSGTGRTRDGSRRGVGVVAEAAAVSVVLTIIKIEFIVCHDQSLLRVKLWGFSRLTSHSIREKYEKSMKKLGAIF